MGLYDNIHLLKHSATVTSIRSGLGTECPPIHVRMEPTESCNFRCQFCIWHDPERHGQIASQVNMTGKRQIPVERFLTLIDELAGIGTLAISFTGTGDPMVYPHMDAVLKRVKEHGIKAGVTSNFAMPLKDETINLLAQCEWVRWSMNGGTEKTYTEIHRPRGKNPAKSYQRSQENVSKILTAMKDKHRLNASFVVHSANQDDTYAAAQLACKIGTSSIAFRPDTPFDRAEQSLNYSGPVLQDILRARKDFDSAQFSVFVNEDRLEDVKKTGDPKLVCFYSNHTTYIAANGDVYPCCYTRYDSRYAIGNIMERDFAEFWNSVPRKEFYRQLVFDNCPSCPHKCTNQALQPLYQGDRVNAVIPDKTDTADPFV